MNNDNTILSRWLSLLGVRHTAAYTDQRFRTMPFPTLFGLSTLLREYGVTAKGYSIDDKTAIGELPTPFIAPVNNDFVIVTAVDGDTLHYCSVGVPEQVPVSEFTDAWSGVAFMAETTQKSIEPDYFKHRMAEVMTRVRNLGIAVVALALFLWFFITRGDLHNWGTIALTAIDMFGLWLSFMLVSKDLGVKSKHSDAVCNILQPGGCDTITKSDASTFLGIFHWSEVGFTYFSVGLATVLLFPHMTGWLAAINLCALPYTVWSISYQKFKAKTWCTMCIGVQLSLWMQFFVFLGSGWLRRMLPFTWETAALLLVYILVMLLLNRLTTFIKSRSLKY